MEWDKNEFWMLNNNNSAWQPAENFIKLRLARALFNYIYILHGNPIAVEIEDMLTVDDCIFFALLFSSGILWVVCSRQAFRIRGELFVKSVYATCTK